MRAEGYLLTGLRTFKLTETNIPDEPSDDDVIMRILYCGICGGDHSSYLGRRPNYPKSLGHEFVGKVLSTGKKVNNVSVGDYVVSDLNFRCGVCEYCLAGKSHLCVKNNIELFSSRAFFNYMMINSSYLYKVDMPLATLYRAVLIEPLSCVIHASHRFSPLRDQDIIINGCGSIGMLSCFFYKEILGFNNIGVHDINYFKSSQLSKVMGVKQIDHLPSERYDFVWESTNSPTGMLASLQTVTKGGKLCVLSHLYGEETSFIYESVCKKELSPIFPLRNGSPSNIITAMECINSKWTDKFDSLLGIYNFEQLPDVFHEKDKLKPNKQIMKMSSNSKKEIE